MAVSRDDWNRGTISCPSLVNVEGSDQQRINRESV
jgi:hypothetical protein